MLERRRLALKSGSAYEGVFAPAPRFKSAKDRIPEVDLQRECRRGWLRRSPPQRDWVADGRLPCWRSSQETPGCYASCIASRTAASANSCIGSMTDESATS